MFRWTPCSSNFSRKKSCLFLSWRHNKYRFLKKHTLGFPLYSVVQLHFLWKKTYLQWFPPLLLIFFHYFWFPPLLLIFFHHHWFRPLLLIFFHYYWFPPLLLIFFNYYWSSVTAHLLPLLALVHFYNSILIDYILFFFVHYQTFSSITVNAWGFIKSTFFYFHSILKKKRIFNILLEILIHDGKWKS